LTNFKKVARADPVIRIPLVNIRDETKESSHILPLDSDDPDALRNSPLYTLVGPDEDLSEMASSLMGPGPWSFHYEAKLPQSCKFIRFSNKNKKSNMITTHILKFVMRVERGDDEVIDAKTGKRKLFDIVVQAPVQILSVREYLIMSVFL
jgi:arrestin-related trafficking adapter 3/6